MRNHFTRDAKETISLSAEEAHRTHATAIGPAHLLLGMIRQEHNTATAILTQDLKISLTKLKAAVEGTLNIPATAKMESSYRFPLDSAAESCIRGATTEAESVGSTDIDADHLLLSLVADKNSNLIQVLNDFGVDYPMVRSRVLYRKDHPY